MVAPQRGPEVPDGVRMRDERNRVGDAASRRGVVAGRQEDIN